MPRSPLSQELRATAWALILACAWLCADGVEHPPVNKPTFEYKEYRSIAELTNAIRETKELLHAAEAKFGSNSTNVAKLLRDLASCYSDLGEDAQALRFSQRSLFIREQLLGPVHKDVADGLSELGFEYWGLGDYEQAELLLRRSL